MWKKLTVVRFRKINKFCFQSQNNINACFANTPLRFPAWKVYFSSFLLWGWNFTSYIWLFYENMINIKSFQLTFGQTSSNVSNVQTTLVYGVLHFHVRRPIGKFLKKVYVNWDIDFCSVGFYLRKHKMESFC